MNCTDVRTRLAARLPTDAHDAALASHLARCADCRAHAETLALLDGRLRTLHARHDVPADFDARLYARIAREAQARPPVERASIEGELDGWLARLRRETLADAGSIAAGGTALAAAAWTLAPETGAWLAHAQSFQGLLLLGAVATGGALAAAWVAVGGAWRTLVARSG
jgi:hypothetical protein